MKQCSVKLFFGGNNSNIIIKWRKPCVNFFMERGMGTAEKNNCIVYCYSIRRVFANFCTEKKQGRRLEGFFLGRVSKVISMQGHADVWRGTSRIYGLEEWRDKKMEIFFFWIGC